MTTIDLTDDGNSNSEKDLDVKIHRPKAQLPIAAVPSSYTCNKCHIKGHWIQQCPGVIDVNGKMINIRNVKRPTGIPASYLTEVEPDTPNSYITSDGRYVITTGTLMALKRSESFIPKIKENKRIAENNSTVPKDISFNEKDTNNRILEKQKKVPKVAMYKSPLKQNESKFENMVPEWCLDKSLEMEIRDIIMMPDEMNNKFEVDIDFTDDIFNLTNMGTKIMLTAEDYAAAKAKKTESILNIVAGKKSSKIEEYQEISVVTFSNEDPVESGFEVNNYVTEDNSALYCPNNEAFFIQNPSTEFPAKEDSVDILQRQLEDEFLNKITNKPLLKKTSIIRGSNHRRRSSHHRHRRARSSQKHKKSDHKHSTFHDEVVAMIQYEKDHLKTTHSKKSKTRDLKSNSRSRRLSQNHKSKTSDRDHYEKTVSHTRSSNRSSYDKHRFEKHDCDKNREKRVERYSQENRKNPQIDTKNQNPGNHRRDACKNRSRSRSNRPRDKVKKINPVDGICKGEPNGEDVIFLRRSPRAEMTDIEEDRWKKVFIDENKVEERYNYNHNSNSKSFKQTSFGREERKMKKMDRNLWTEEYTYKRTICNSRSQSGSDHCKDADRGSSKKNVSRIRGFS